MNIPRSIISLSSVRHTGDVTKRMPSFKVISPRVQMLYGIKGIQCGQEDLRDDLVSNYRGVEWETGIVWV